MAYDENGNWSWTDKDNVKTPLGLSMASLATDNAEMNVSVSKGPYSLTASSFVDGRGHLSEEEIVDVSFGISITKELSLKAGLNEFGFIFLRAPR